ncbi:MAG: hemolysin III family protein [Anaerolineae bacterium]|nr:hemolysin III family protein [Anaerolineae bacterium]
MFGGKRPSPQIGFYSFKEELLNSVTHGIGSVLAAVGMVTLVVLALLYGDGWRVLSFAIYGGCLLFLYLASTLYHGVQRPRWKRVLRVMDHTAVYLLIAGTYTPFLLVKMRDPMGLTLLAVVWGMALLGIAFKVLFIGRYEKWATLGYLFMGWMCLIAFRQMIVVMPAWGLFGIIVGGLFYTAGVIFYVGERIPYNHTIWHLFVMGGSVAHFVTILVFLLPLGVVIRNP